MENEFHADLDKELSREHLLENSNEDQYREDKDRVEEETRVAHEDQVLVELSER